MLGTRWLLLILALPLTSCPEPTAPDVPPVTSAATSALDAAPPPPTPAQPVIASFVDAPGNVSAPICSRLMIAVAKGRVTALSETLDAGDVLVVNHPDDVKLAGSGLVVAVIRKFDPSECGVKARPSLERTVVRANAAPELRWGKGAMAAHLDIGKALSPDVYLGRLEAGAPVPEHEHGDSWEIVADIDGSGTLVIDGVEKRIGPREIAFIPPHTKHSLRPDPKLVAVQMYSPPGPEQRFVGFATAERDAGLNPVK